MIRALTIIGIVMAIMIHLLAYYTKDMNLLRTSMYILYMVLVINGYKISKPS